ncbi:MAG: potassium channel protein [Chitinophagaceae bacterium]|nr:potassium channel protein [Chitinophagaceae bacterium]
MLIWFGIISLILLTGITGFMLIDGFRFLDALYMTVITITTIGYGEIKHMSDAGRIFNIFLIIASFSIFTYALANLTQFIASGEMALYFKNKKMMSALNKLNNHVIICGYGRNGQQVAKTLSGHKVPSVIIDQRDEHLQAHFKEDPTLLFIKGDATEDAVLRMAGIDRARSLVCALPTDADNVFIVLSARSLNNQLHIISRASAATSMPKLKKAGANHVIMPDKIGGTHMATLVSKPDVVEFIDYLSGAEGESINIESVAYNKLPQEFRNATLKEIMEWKKTGVNCIGVKDQEGKFLINPPDDFVVKEGMKIIVLGTKQQISTMTHNVG